MKKSFKAALYSLKYNVKNTLLIMVSSIASYYALLGNKSSAILNIWLIFIILMVSGKNFRVQFNGKIKMRIPYMIIPISALIGVTMYVLQNDPKMDNFFINGIIMFIFNEIILLVYDMSTAN